jgi:hypothetical protein
MMNQMYSIQIAITNYELRQFPLVPMGVLASRQFQGLLVFFHLFQKKLLLWSLCLPGIFKNSGHYVWLPSS